jgi:hypothetical protein
LHYFAYQQQHAKRRTGTGARVKTSREENGENGYNTRVRTQKKVTTPKEGTRLNKNKSFKDEKF